MSNDAMLRLNAALEGRYRVERQLGEGGMATVYLADDLKHERKVALKVLKPELAAVVGAERFLAEIKTTANLQHPHILPLFDSGEADGFLFYVMPYVAGESLRDRLDREHQLSVDEAVRIAQNIAEALDYAHRQGVIHRDIKPANVLMLDGKPVVSDFGIALAVGAAGGGRLTETGLSLGTPFYMSPEQATGDQVVGPATDTYALGCVLYEMLIGDPPYVGSTAQAVLGKIIQGTPVSATESRRTVPPHVDAAIRRALEKIPADRFTGPKEFAQALSDPAFRHGVGAGVGGGTTGPWNPLAVAMTLTTVLLAAWIALAPEAPRPVARFPSPFVEGQEPMGAAMEFTADGSALVYTGLGPGGDGTQLWIRRWDGLEASPIPGTEGARAASLAGLSLSPDGREVAFVPGEGVPLRVVPLAGGPSRTLVESAWAVGGWSEDGWIYFQDAGTGIQRVRETGGEAEILTERDEGEAFHTLPQLLLGGRGLVFQVFRNQSGADSEIWALDLESRERTLLIRGSNPRYVPTGHLLFGAEGGRLMAARFDVRALSLTGPAVPVAEGLTTDPLRGNVTYVTGPTGGLVYLSGEARDQRAGHELIVVDLDGSVETLPLSPRPMGGVGWSPDGENVVYWGSGPGSQIFIYNATLNATPRQITFEGSNFEAVFSPDGSRLIFGSIREGLTDGPDLFVKNLNDDTPPRMVFTAPSGQFASHWFSDSVLVFTENARAGAPGDLWILDLSDPETPRAEPYLTSEANLSDMVVSPDGALAAYASSETGQEEIYLRSFPEPGERTVVSQGGGIEPFWSPDGATLYFSRPGQFLAARLQRNPVPTVLSIDTLFPTELGAAPTAGAALHPDGDRWVLRRQGGMGQLAQTVQAQPILVENFFEELKRLVPN